MSHFKDYQSTSASPDNRTLGDEWLDWDGRDNADIRTGFGLFILSASATVSSMIALAGAFTYMIVPRLELWSGLLPFAAWTLFTALSLFCAVWASLFIATIVSEKKLLPGRKKHSLIFGAVLSGAFLLAKLFGISRDKMGHSFVRASNRLSRAMKKNGGSGKLLILLPRCLVKDDIRRINELKDIYPLEVHTVSGGELARKKVKELRPTAIIGVACERDLVSGIKDVGGKLSVIGLPNMRPEGPCKNTRVNMSELISAVEFFMGPAKGASQSPQ